MHTVDTCRVIFCCLQTKYEAQRALLKNGMVLSTSIMIGVQPLANQFKHLFDSPAEVAEDSSMKIPSSTLKEQELSAKVSMLLKKKDMTNRKNRQGCAFSRQ